MNPHVPQDHVPTKKSPRPPDADYAAIELYCEEGEDG